MTKKYARSLLILWLCVASATGPVASAFSADRATDRVAEAGCASTLQRPGIAGRVRGYLSELRQTRGRSAFLRTPDTQTADVRLNGLFTSREGEAWSIFSPFRPLVQFPSRYVTRKAWFFGRAYDLTPLLFLSRQGLRPATRWTTRALFKKPYELSRLSLAIGLMFLWTGYDSGSKWLIVHKQLTRLESHQAAYDEIVATDFRFHEINVGKDRLHFTRQETLVYSAELRMAEQLYFEYMDNHYDADYAADPHATDLKLLNDPMYGALQFGDIFKIYTNGVPVNAPEFLYSQDFKPKMTDAQLDLLLKNRHFALHKYEYIRGLFEKYKTREEILADSDVRFLFDRDESYDFLEKALDRFASGVWSKGQTVRTLQLAANWEERFANDHILGVGLRQEKDGAFTDQPLALQTIMDQLLNPEGDTWGK